MSFQFFNPAPVYFDLLGVDPIMGGSITFYDKGTTELRDTWNREEQGDAYLNTNPIILDAAGRSPVQIWMDGEYSYVIRDAGGVTIRAGDFTSGQSAGASIPPLAPGFLTNDATNLAWQTIRQVPDPSGMNNRLLSTDGANLLWIEPPEPPVIPEPEIVVELSPFLFQAGTSDDATKYFQQAGSGSALATGGRDTNASVTFPNQFAAAPFVMIQPTNVSNSGGPMVSELTAVSASGFTTNFTIAAGSGADAKIFNPVPFAWVAFGTRTVVAEE